jgi:hypothetical protein
MNTNMNDLKQFNKLPMSGRAILTEYEMHKDKNELFNAINANVATQKTVSSKSVRRAIFRGILRRHFKMADDQMKKIESTEESKHEYFNVLKSGFEKQRVNTIDKSLLQKISSQDIINYLLMTSGLRIRELIDNESKFENGKIYFKIDKKITSDFYEIKPIINGEKWYKTYQLMKLNISNRPITSVINGLNKRLKRVIPADFYKKSSHICRAIFAAYSIKFRNPDKLTSPQLITKILRHNVIGSSTHYQYIKLSDDVDDFIE